MNNKKHPIVFIHGMWSTPEIWHTFREFYQNQGYTVHTPALRHHEPESQDKELLAQTSINDYLGDLAAFIDTLDEKPILIGHSLGGLLALQLASRDLAARVVLLSPLAPAGFISLRTGVILSFAKIFTRWKFWEKPIKLSPKDADYGVFNRLALDVRSDHYKKMVYESGRALSQVFFWIFDRSRATRIKKVPDCPVLVIAAEHDRMSSAKRCRNIARCYHADYILLKGHGHWLPVEIGRERIAQQCAIWLTLDDDEAQDS